MAEDLILAEEALLLVLHDEKGTHQGSYTSFVLAGAALAEFALEGRIVPEGEGKKMRFRLVDDTPPEHPFLRFVLDAMTAKKGFERKPEHLVDAAANKRGGTLVLKDALVSKGILEARQEKVLFFFTRTTYPLRDASVEEALKARLAQIMFHGHPPTEHESILIALAKHAGLLSRNFDKKLLKEHKDRIESVAEGSGVAANATKSAIEAVQAAIMATIIAGSVATTVAT